MENIENKKNAKVDQEEKQTILKNGTKRGRGGRFVSGPTTGLITPEKSRELLALRREKRRESVERGLVRAVEGKTGKQGYTSNEAIEVIAEKIGETALNPGSSRQIEAARFAFERAGWETQDPPVVESGELKMDKGMAEFLLAVMDSYEQRSKKDVDIVEGEVKDV